MKKETLKLALKNMEIIGADILSIRKLRDHLQNLLHNFHDIDPLNYYDMQVIDYFDLYNEPAYRIKIVRGTGRFTELMTRKVVLVLFFPFVVLETTVRRVPEVTEILVVTLGDLVYQASCPPVSRDINGVHINHFDEQAFDIRRAT